MRKTLVFIITTLILTTTLAAQGWGEDVRLTVDPAASYTSDNGTWCIASSGDNIHAVWYDSRNGGHYEIYHKKSSNRGLTWSEDTCLTNSTGDAYHPCIAMSGDRIHLVWHDTRDGNREIYYKRSNDNGLSWSPDTRLTIDGSISMRPTVAVSGENIHVVWKDNRDGNWEIYYKHSTDNGVSWSSDTNLTNANETSEDPSIAVSDNNVHVVWADNRDGNFEIYYKASNDNGFTWESEDIRLTNDAHASQQASVAASENNVHVVWSEARDGNWEVYYKRSVDNGISWESDTGLTNAINSSRMPSIAVSDDKLHVVWHDDCDNSQGKPEIYYKCSIDNGLSWQSDERLTFNPQESWSSSVAVSDDYIHVLWHDWSDGNPEVYYKRSLPPGAPGTLAWKCNLGSRSYSHPAIANDGTLYLGANNSKFYSIDSSGIINWEYQTGGRVMGAPVIGPDGTIYVGSEDDYLYAFTPSGVVKWRFKTGDNIGSSPAIAGDGTIYFGSADGNLYALDPDGNLVWKYNAGSLIYSSPAIAEDGTIYFGAYNNWFYALDPSGDLKWKFLANFGVSSSPAIGVDGTVYFCGWDNYLYALNPDGTEKWRFLTGGGQQIWSSPTIAEDGTIYCHSNNNNIYAVDPDGNLKWKYYTGPSVSTATVGSDGVICFGVWGDNSLHAVNSDGARRWTYLTGGNVRGTPTIQTNGLVYVTSDDGYLYAVHSSSQGLAESSWPKFKHDLQNTGRAPVSIITAVVDFDPDKLNFKSKGKWVTCYIELPAPHSAEDIDLSTVAIVQVGEEILDPALFREGPTEIGDHDSDGVTDLMVKFDRQALIAVLQSLGYEDGDEVELTVAGELITGENLAGSDVINSLDKGKDDENDDGDNDEGDPDEGTLFSSGGGTPNPFTVSTTLTYRLNRESEIQITVYDALGRRVRTLINRSQTPGDYTIIWDGRDDACVRLPQGVYLISLEVDGNAEALTRVILK